jgi:hypothetical protein
MLNIGYDNNYHYARGDGRNPNIFFNLNGYWEKVNSTITGTLMMRPLVGERIKNNSNSVNELSGSFPEIRIYPNPGNSIIHIQSPISIKSIKLFDMSGKQIFETEGDAIESADPGTISNGIYYIELRDENNRIYRQKWIRQS